MRSRTTLLAAAAICAFVAATGATLESGRAAGTLKIAKVTAKPTYAWAKRDTSGNLEIRLADKLVSSADLEGFSALSEMEKRGEIHVVEITIFHNENGYEGFVLTTGGEMVGSNIADKMKLSLSKATDDEVEGRIVAPKGTKMLDKSVSGELSFHAPVGSDQKYAGNPIAAKELSARIARLGENAASGTLKVEGKSVPLKYAYAYMEKNPFNRKKKKPSSCSRTVRSPRNWCRKRSSEMPRA